MSEFFDSLHPSSNTKVVLESSGMWYSIYECLSKRHLDVRLSNPVKTRAIASAKIKTDKLDAIKLADLLRGGYIAGCYVPNKRIMGLRDIVRHRAALVRMRTKLKNKVYSITLMRAIPPQMSIIPILFPNKIWKDRIAGYLRIIKSLDLLRN